MVHRCGSNTFPAESVAGEPGADCRDTGSLLRHQPDMRFAALVLIWPKMRSATLLGDEF